MSKDFGLKEMSDLIQTQTAKGESKFGDEDFKKVTEYLNDTTKKGFEFFEENDDKYQAVMNAAKMVYSDADGMNGMMLDMDALMTVVQLLVGMHLNGELS